MRISRDGRRGWACAILAALGLAAASGCGPAIDRPSVLLITLDTTRADRLGAYGRADAGTRHLDALAQQGALFESAFTPVPITLPAHATIMTGTYPNRHGVRDNGYRLDSALTTLAEILQRQEYTTAAVVSAFPLYARFGLDRGFDVYDDAMSLPKGEGRLFRQRTAEQVVERATAWLDELVPGERFLLWAHFFDPHTLYKPPPPYDDWYASDPYQGEIAYMDEWIGKLLAHLDELGLAQDTLVVAVADHGEGLGQHEEVTHSHLVYNSTMHVPLILRGPGIGQGLRVSTPVSIVDVLPTLLDLLSLEVPDQLQGLSLAPILAGGLAPERALYLESFYARLHHGWSELQGVVAEGFKYIEAPAAGRRGELYDLSSDADEVRDRLSEEPDRAQRLRDQLDALREEGSVSPPESTQHPIGAEERRELEALGYLTAQVEQPAEGVRHPRDMVAVTAAYVEAKGMIEHGFPGRAGPLVEKIERLDPGSSTAHEIRGRYLLVRGEDDPALLPRALEELQLALAASPHSAEMWRQVAEAYLALGDWPNGLRHFHRAIEVAPPMPDLQRDYGSLLEEAAQRADELEQAGQYAQAAALLDAMAEIEPSDPEPARRAESLRRRISHGQG